MRNIIIIINDYQKTLIYNKFLFLISKIKILLNMKI